MTYDELAKIFKKNAIDLVHHNDNEIVVQGTIIDRPLVKKEGEIAKFIKRQYVVKIDEYGELNIFLSHGKEKIFIKTIKRYTGVVRLLKTLLCC